MADQASFRPATTGELCELVMAAAADGRKLVLRAGGSKDGVGAPQLHGDLLDMGAFSGVVDYDPPELVLTVKAATPLAEIAPLLAARDQMLAFAPYDPAALFGAEPGRATIGGTIAAAISGSQRLSQGAARDHLLGFTAVSGRGEHFVAGAKVVKNVTGYDLPKIMCGSWGRLAALTEVTLKVLPRPASSATMIAVGLSADAACMAMAHALGSQAEIAAAAHIPAGILGEEPVTALRLQGFAPSVEARCAMVGAMTVADCRFSPAGEADGAAIWSALVTLDGLGHEKPLWRISMPPRHAPAFLAAVDTHEARWMMDWGGGLLWMTSDGDASQLRAAAAKLGGHAMLMRASPVMRTWVPVFHPQSPPVAALEERVRRAFDPAGVFETGRF